MKPIAVLLAGLLTMAAAALNAEPPTLFERVGGRDTLAAIADDYVDTIMMDSKMHENPHVARMSEVAPRDYIKEQITIIFCERSGGPCTHRTRSMDEAFAPMQYREQDWARSRSLFAEAIAENGVVQPEADELLEIFGTMEKHFLPGDRAAK